MPKTTGGGAVKNCFGFCTALVLLGVSLLNGPAMALTPYDTPVITCEGATLSSITLRACGGPSGAPAGVTIQWKTADDYASSGWADDGTLCKLSLSGQPSLQHPGASRWELLPGECENIQIGDINFDETGVSGHDCGLDPLECGTEYVFRWFAHAGRGFGRSDFGGDLTCSTAACPPQRCTFTQGYWKTHGPAGCVTGQNTNQWPAGALPMTLGTSGHLYSATELCSILQATPAGGNCLISLAHQLISAKLNLANGATTCSGLASAIASAEAQIGTKIVPPVGPDFIGCGTTISGITTNLDLYNNGGLCSPNCHGSLRDDSDSDADAAPVPANSTWGEIKSTYR
jgi:hypothetical protein